MFDIHVLIPYVLPLYQKQRTKVHISQGILEGLFWVSMVVGVVVDDSVATITITSSILIII